jgi:hypothetical protein
MNYTKLRGCRDHMVVGFTTTYTINASRPSIPITLWNLKWIGQGVLKLERDMWNGRTDSRTLVYHNTSRLKDGRIKTQLHISRCKLRTPWPIHFKLRIVIRIDSLTVCILFGEISIFHSRFMGFYSSNCRRFFVCRAANQFTARYTKNLLQFDE